MYCFQASLPDSRPPPVCFSPPTNKTNETFYLTTHSTHFIYGYMASDIWLRTILIAREETRCHHIGSSFRLAEGFFYMEGRKEGKVLFNDALNTFYLWLYSIGHMIKHLSDSETGNPLPPHRLLFPISSMGSFICTIPQTE